jgi:hypothetical protein
MSSLSNLIACRTYQNPSEHQSGSARTPQAIFMEDVQQQKAIANATVPLLLGGPFIEHLDNFPGQTTRAPDEQGNKVFYCAGLRIKSPTLPAATNAKAGLGGIVDQTSSHKHQVELCSFAMNLFLNQSLPTSDHCRLGSQT